MARITVALLTLCVSACGDEGPLPAPIDFFGRDAGKGSAGAKPRDAGKSSVGGKPRDAGTRDVEEDPSDEAEEDEGDDDDTGATAGPGTDAAPVASKDAGQRTDAAAPAAGAADCAELTYESFGKKFVAKYCTECHSGTSSTSALAGVALDSLPNIQKNKMYLKKVTAPRTDGIEPRMPKGGNDDLTNEERAKFGAWIDCGPK